MVVAVTVAVVVVSLVCALVVVVVVALAARRMFRRVRRRIDALVGRAGEVRTRFLPPGPHREAALLRQRLHAELRATRDMLEAAPDGLIFRADAGSVLHELVTVAVDVDRELRAVERFLDPAQQRAALKTVRPQAEQLIDTTYTARHTVLSTAATDRGRHLATLHADVTRQAAALDRYRQTTGELRL
jgi:hypothetical protein